MPETSTLCSFDEILSDHVGMPRRYAQERQPGPLRGPPTLFPVSQCADADTQSRRKLRLRHADESSQSRDILAGLDPPLRDAPSHGAWNSAREVLGCQLVRGGITLVPHSSSLRQWRSESMVHSVIKRGPDRIGRPPQAPGPLRRRCREVPYLGQTIEVDVLRREHGLEAARGGEDETVGHRKPELGAQPGASRGPGGDGVRALDSGLEAEKCCGARDRMPFYDKVGQVLAALGLWAVSSSIRPARVLDIHLRTHPALHFGLSARVASSRHGVLKWRSRAPDP